jgi:uncharacterized membrane protein YphA (DoxX/SURF4 family)
MKILLSIFVILFSALSGVSLVAGFNDHPKQFMLSVICLFMASAILIELTYKKKPKKTITDDEFLYDCKIYNEDEHRI